ncbi:MAG: hypothetical protein FJZ58_01145 [Chlamydiae bacterium]|nr:hypothetical protein [Chlamydiota bacterium]
MYIPSFIALLPVGEAIATAVACVLYFVTGVKTTALFGSLCNLLTLWYMSCQVNQEGINFINMEEMLGLA